MKWTPSEPPRLLDLRQPDATADVARLVRSAIKAPADPVPPLKWRIRRTLRRKSLWRRRYVRASVIGGIIFLTGGVVGAVVHPILDLRRPTRVASVENVYPAAPGQRPRPRRALAPALPPPTSEVALAPGPTVEPATPPAMPVPSPPLPTVTARTARADTSITRAAPTRANARPAPPSATTPAPVMAAPARAPATGAELPSRTAMLEPPPSPTMPREWHAPDPLAGSVPTPLAPPPAPVGRTTQPIPVAAAPAASAPPPVPVVAPAPSEQTLLARAVRSLRSERRPENALAALDEYVARYPNGSLLPEAARLRTEALLALGHKGAALAELSRDQADGSAGGEERRLVRGELRAAEGRWAQALGDFDAVVRAHDPVTGATVPAKVRDRLERALWGRASARSHLGDDAGARADLQECLRRFPQGRFAARAAHLLGELR